MYSPHRPYPTSYRRPRLIVRRSVALQSSWIQPAPTSRLLWKWNVPIPCRNVFVIDESGARFHVSALLMSGKSDATLAGIGPLLASIDGLQLLQKKTCCG